MMIPQSRTVLTASVILAGACLLSGVLLGRAARTHSSGDAIRVTGSARRIVRSDNIIWTARVTDQAPSVEEAYRGLQTGVGKLTGYLVSRGLSSAEIFPLAIRTEALYVKDPNGGVADDVYRKAQGYRLSQEVEVRSKQVELVQSVSRTATDLINQGVSLQSSPPQYRITGLADLKDSILAEAAGNAKTRAGQIARSSGAALGSLRFSHMGAMTVTGAYEDDAQEEGGEDTKSLDKKVTVMVTSAYDIR